MRFYKQGITVESQLAVFKYGFAALKSSMLLCLEFSDRIVSTLTKRCIKSNSILSGLRFAETFNELKLRTINGTFLTPALVRRDKKFAFIEPQRIFIDSNPIQSRVRQVKSRKYCFAWNGGKCEFNVCKFTHRCMHCDNAHRAVDNLCKK